MINMIKRRNKEKEIKEVINKIIFYKTSGILNVEI